MLGAIAVQAVMSCCLSSCHVCEHRGREQGGGVKGFIRYDFVILRIKTMVGF